MKRLSQLRVFLLFATLGARLAATITTNASVSPAVLINGGSITLTRDGSASAGISWTENVIQKPDSSTTNLGNAGLGSSSYTPNGGPGVYWYHFRIVDANNAYADQSIPFVVGSIERTDSATFQVGNTHTLRFSIESIDRVLRSTDGTSNGSSGWGDFTSDGESSGHHEGEYLATTAGSKSVTITADSAPWGPEDCTTPATPGAPSVVYWSRTFNFTVSKATPAVAWNGPAVSQNATRAGSYALTSTDVGKFVATFSNPHTSNSAVAGPSGTVTYRLGGTTTTFATSLSLERGTYYVDASYPGDANYNAASSTSPHSLVINAPVAPTALEIVLGSTVQLKWPSQSGLTAFDIYRNGTLLASVSGSSTSYTDTTAPIAGETATVQYQLRAVDSSDRGSPAASASLANPGGTFEVFTPTP